LLGQNKLLEILDRYKSELDFLLVCAVNP